MTNLFETIVDKIYSFFIWCFNYFLSNPIKGIILFFIVVIFIFIIIQLIKWFFGTVLNGERN